MTGLLGRRWLAGEMNDVDGDGLWLSVNRRQRAQKARRMWSR